MSDHSKALVALESWGYNSPELRYRGQSVDIGLMAEALVYYDSLLLNVANQPQFATLIEWFANQGHFGTLISLMEDGVIGFYDYSFMSTAILKDGVYTLMNMQDPIQAKPNTFETRYLAHPSVREVLPKGRIRKRFYEAIRKSVIEAKAAEFSDAIENAREDYNDPRRSALVLQAFVDDLYAFRDLGRPPTIQASIQQSVDGATRTTTYDIDLNRLKDLAGPQINFHRGAILTAGAISNRLILSASRLDCDLYLGSPTSNLVGDKLYESSYRILKAGQIVDSLERSVEFPDLRRLVNEARLNLDDIMTIRREGIKFRQWLQSETERDRDALIAYHHEVAQKSGFSKAATSTIRLFGVLSAGAIAGVLQAKGADPAAWALAGAGAAGLPYLVDVATSVRAQWRPIVFGRWVQDRVRRLMEEFPSN